MHDFYDFCILNKEWSYFKKMLLLFSWYKSVWDIGIYLMNMYNQIFTTASANKPLAYVPKFEVNHDYRTRCTKCWSNLTLKGYIAYTYTLICESWCTNHGRKLTDYLLSLKGYSYPEPYCKKLSNQKSMANTASTTRRTT